MPNGILEVKQIKQLSADGGGTVVDVENKTITATSASLDGAVTINDSGADVDFRVESDTNENALFVEGSSGNVGIGTSSPQAGLQVAGTFPSLGIQETDQGTDQKNWDFTVNGNLFRLRAVNDSYSAGVNAFSVDRGTGTAIDNISFYTGAGTEAMRIDSSGNVLVGTTSTSDNATGINLQESGTIKCARESNIAGIFNRKTNDGDVIRIVQDGITEGTISVSGTAVSYNGGHLARWSQLPDDSKDNTIVKGTVMTNLDAMCEWTHQATEDRPAYTEDNEQLNRMTVSSVEGDPNVAGVFVSWDNDDDQFNDMIIAMTGDMVIRIAQGTTIQRGDLLMSAGDGTAKPQGDDIVRSKTVAKVTSTHVSHTYDDGTYLVPCVLMAC